MEFQHVPVTLHSPPGDNPREPATGTIADTPENRAALEAAAIPRCQEWREANPEHISCHGPVGANGECEFAPAPYCCSAYCDRCAGLRALDGEQPLLPNEWMTK